MRHITFFSTPAYGHLTCVHPVISGLVACGYSVTWYCSGRYRDFVIRSGAVYVEYEGNFDEICDLGEATGNLFSLFGNLLSLNRRYYLQYVDAVLVGDTDLILYDSMCSFAKNIALRHGIPHICLCTTLAYNTFSFVFSNLFWSTTRLIFANMAVGRRLIGEENEFRRGNGLPRLDLMDLFMNTGCRTLVFSPREFQTMASTFGRDIHFVGTTIGNRINMDTSQYGDCDVYISLGSIFTERRDLLERMVCSRWLRNRNVVINIGNLAMDSPCGNIRLVSHTNQMEILRHCRFFVNHGGLNSVFESIWSGVPQICIPQQEEQRMNALILQRKGLGVCLDDYREGALEDMERMYQSYKTKADAFSQVIRRYDGTQNAVDLIRQFL